QADLRIIGQRSRLARLFLKATNPVFDIDLHDPEAGALTSWHGDAADGQVGAMIDVTADHVAIVHLVNVIPRQDQDVAWFRFLDAVNVLVYRVRRALVPMFVDALLRRQDLNVLLKLPAEEAPTRCDMAIQTTRLVLRENEDAAQVAVDAI